MTNLISFVLLIQALAIFKWLPHWRRCLSFLYQPIIGFRSSGIGKAPWAYQHLYDIWNTKVDAIIFLFVFFSLTYITVIFWTFVCHSSQGLFWTLSPPLVQSVQLTKGNPRCSEALDDSWLLSMIFFSDFVYIAWDSPYYLIPYLYSFIHPHTNDMMDPSISCAQQTPPCGYKSMLAYTDTHQADICPGELSFNRLVRG